MPSTDDPPVRNVWFNRLLPVAVLVSAWLLFQVQPMVAKRLLPWFGGGTAIWTTTMLFFQTMLFAGYLYAHIVGSRLTPRRQALVHATLLAAAVCWLAFVRVVPSDRWIPATVDRPVVQILTTLAACVGLPFLLLSATAPLSQVWFARVNPGVTPYRLYALSNAGSLAALLSYPFLIEPNLGLERQGVAWSVLFAGFAILLVGSAALSLRTPGEQPFIETPAISATKSQPQSAPFCESSARPRTVEHFFWIALPACASVMLLDVTTYLCQDVASIPMLWIVPMVVYLLSFILTFESDRWYRRWSWLGIMACSSLAAATTWHFSDTIGWKLPLASHLLMLAGACMVCHGELARMRPPAERLTGFYLSLSAGGAIGGLLSAIVAPLVLNDNLELPLGMAAVWLLALAVLATDRQSTFYRGRAPVPLFGVALLFVGFIAIMGRDVAVRRADAVAMDRNFYGSLKVREIAAGYENIAYFKLTNGNTSHGAQFSRPDRRRLPTQYYHPQTGVGQLLTPQSETPRRVGVVGLGVGTLASYAEKGHTYRFYDINPLVIQFADKYFTYLSDARERGAHIEIVEGDARLQLQNEPSQHFDVLALDAFNSDSIPTHLLTLEAFEIYLRHLQPDGVLAVHVSSRYLDLTRVVKAAAEHFQLRGLLVAAQPDNTPGGAGSVWVLLARPAVDLASRATGVPLDDPQLVIEPVTWIDDHNNVVDVLMVD